MVIGKDTRLSGYMIEPALVAGFASVGMDVRLFGPLPTPAVAMMTMPSFPQLALASMLMAVSLSAAALGLGSFARLSRPLPPTFAALALVLALGCGLAATVTGEVIYAQIPVMFAVACTLPFAFLRMLLLILLGAAMLLGGGLALLDSGVNAAALFFAASLLALTRGLVRLKPAVT